MFDTVPDTPPRTPTRTPHDTVPGEIETDLVRLCRRYDILLTEGRGVGEVAANELVAMAGIYDLDGDRPLEALWRDLRAVLVRQTGVDPDARSSRPTGELTLLVVEDDPQAAQDLTEMLGDAGHRIIGPFHDGDAAEAAAGLHNLDGALLDINLSGATDGVQLAERLKARWGVPVVFLSGDIAAAARNAGLAEALVAKPYGRKDVLEALARLPTA